MNQVTTKTSGDGLATLVPALGESFAHTCTTRVLLFWRNRLRHAHLYKSPRLPLVGALPHANLHLTATSQRRERGPGGLTCGYLVDSGRGCMVYAGDGAV